MPLFSSVKKIEEDISDTLTQYLFPNRTEKLLQSIKVSDQYGFGFIHTQMQKSRMVTFNQNVFFEFSNVLPRSLQHRSKHLHCSF